MEQIFYFPLTLFRAYTCILKFWWITKYKVNLKARPVQYFYSESSTFIHEGIIRIFV